MVESADVYPYLADQLKQLIFPLEPDPVEDEPAFQTLHTGSGELRFQAIN